MSFLEARVRQRYTVISGHHKRIKRNVSCLTNTLIKSRRMRWAGHVERMGEMILYRVLVGKPEGKITLGRPRSRWEDNIKMDLQEMGCGSVDWIELAQDRERRRARVTAVMNLLVP
jgi:hypothetical protein